MHQADLQVAAAFGGKLDILGEPSCVNVSVERTLPWWIPAARQEVLPRSQQCG